EWYIATALLSPLTFIVGTYLAATLWWIALRAVGGLQRGFREIVRALCYAQTFSLLAPIVAPLGELGPVGSGVAMAIGLWGVWVQIIGVSRMQGIPIVRGALSFIVLLIISTVGIGVAFAVSGWWLATQIA